MKKVLITGKTSYIGRSFKNYVEKNYGSQIQVDSISVRGDAWQQYDFSGYDAVLHVAGKAHVDVSSVSNEEQQEYYRINRDLARKVAEKYKSDRVGFSQFIYLSSIIVYGNKTTRITSNTKTSPENFYGDSKLQGELALKTMASKNFQVLTIRPPMIYGNGSKGNFPLLVKLALRVIFFPKINNQRSMLYIDNLSAFIVQLITASKRTNLYFPQNEEYVDTSELVSMIRKSKGKKIILVPGLHNLIRFIMRRKNRLGIYTSKAFGNLVYDKGLSKASGIPLNAYQTVSFSESIRRSV